MSSQAPSSIRNFIKSSNVQIQRDNSMPRSFRNNIINNENMGNFAQFVYNSNSNNSPPPKTIKLSGLNPGMYNATINKNYDAAQRVDLKQILRKRPFGKTSIGQGLFIETKELAGVYGRFKTGFSHTINYGEKGNINQNFFTVQIKFSITDGTETNGGTFNIYKNGKIRFSGGFVGKNIENQPELVRKFMVSKYTQGQQFFYNPIEYNNLSGQFRINGVIKNMDLLASRGRVYNLKISYDPEISPMMYVTYKNYKYIVAKSGAVQISGAENYVEMKRAYDAAETLFSMLNTKGHIMIKTNIPMNMTKKKITRVKASSCPKSRRPPCKPGFEAKKNPQGDECCYKVPKKKSTRKSPRANDLKVTYDKDGNMFIGKKKCDKLTKSTLLDMAKKLGAVGAKDKNKKEKLCEMIRKLDLGNSNFNVKGRSCGTYKKSELVGIAMSKGVEVTDADTVKSLCEKLKIRKEKKRSNNVLAREINRELKKNAANTETKKKRRLNNASVKNDIVKLYGERWMKKYKNVMNLDKDVRDVTKLLNNYSKNKNLSNKKGILKKMPANDIKRVTVQEWKLNRKLEYDTKLARAKYGKYGNAVVNFVVTKKPTEAQIKKFIKIRQNLAKNK